MYFFANFGLPGLCIFPADAHPPVPSHPFLPPPPAEQPGAPGRSRLTSVGPDVPFQIKGVVEAFPAEGAQVSLHLAVALDVAVEHALQAEALATQLAGVHRGIVTGARGELGKGTGPAELYRHGKDHKKKKKKTSCLGSSPFSTAR